jgi:hypothetical protein
MKTRILAVLGVVALGLLGCSRSTSSEPTSVAGQNRYLGVGVYHPGAAWTHLADNQQPGASAAAKPSDDQVIIVVEDSRTGELRACGDLTGYCIGMNPWKTELIPSRQAPIGLTEHATPAVLGDGGGKPTAPARISPRWKPLARPAHRFPSSAAGNSVG